MSAVPVKVFLAQAQLSCRHEGKGAPDPVHVRGVPREIDVILRRKAAQRSQSLNQIILDELAAATGGRKPEADFSEVVGRWTADAAFGEVIDLLNRLLTKPTVGILLPARETAEQYARLFVQLKRAGTPVPDNDLWIAALALEHDLILITREKTFPAHSPTVARIGIVTNWRREPWPPNSGPRATS